jgi:hypothetical protein
VCYPDKSNPAGEASQNLTVTPTPVRRKRGGQKGNWNARKHGFYSATSPLPPCSSPYERAVRGSYEILLLRVRVKLQSSLQHDPANRRVIREASRLLVKWYSAHYRLDPIDRNYLKTVVESLFEIASMRQSASPRLAKINGNPTKRIVRTLTTKRQSASHRLAEINGNPTKRIVRILTTKSAAGSHPTYEKDLLISRKNSDFYKTNHPGFPHGLPPYDPNNNIVCIYAQNDTIEYFPFPLFVSHKV